MHNLTTVIKFEILKQIRKPLFWLAVFAIPAMMVVFGLIGYFGGEMAEKQSEVAQGGLKDQLVAITIVDHTGLIKSEAFAPLKVHIETDDETAQKQFKTAPSNEALIIYPSDPANEVIQTWTKKTDDATQTQQLSMGVGAIAKSALSASTSEQVDPKIAAILSAPSLVVDSQIIDESGASYDPIKKMILPGIFLILLFFIFTLTGNQTLVATTEEKENRIAEMILTTINAKTLIVGKIIALATLGFIQIIALLAPTLLLYFAGTKLNLVPPFLNNLLTGVQFEFWPFFFGITLLISGFLLMTGFTVLVGSLFPTAQDASQFYAPIVLGMILPVYFAGAIFTGAKSIIVTILTYFPLSAPFTLLMRNTAGNLSVGEGLIGLALVLVSTVIIMLLAVKAFRFGVFEYGKRVSLSKLWQKQKNSKPS